MKPRLLSFFAKNVIILMFGYSTISYAYVIWVYSTSNSRKNVLISIKITFPFWAIRYFSSFFMTNIIRFLHATRDFLKIHICDQTNFLSATLNGWNIVIHTTLLMVLLYKYYIKNIPNLQILKYTFTLAHISSRLWYYPPIIYCLPQ